MMRGGDKAAFGVLFDRYYDLLHTFARHIVKDSSVAEDIIQNVFVKMWMRKEQVNPELSVRNYLLVATRNELIDYMRLRYNMLRSDINAAMLNVADGLVVYPKVVRSRLMAELPFMASENIMMQAVEKGGNRQELHERLRQHAIAAGKQVKEEGLPNDMVDRIAAAPAFGLTREEIVAGLVPENFVGRAPQQVEEFIANVLQPIFDADPEDVEQHASLSV